MLYNSPLQFIPTTHDNRTVPRDAPLTYHGCLCVAHVDGWAERAEMCDKHALREHAVPNCAHCNGTGLEPIPEHYLHHDVPAEHSSALLDTLDLSPPDKMRQRVTLAAFQRTLTTARTARTSEATPTLCAHLRALTQLVWTSHAIGAAYMTWE